MLKCRVCSCVDCERVGGPLPCDSELSAATIDAIAEAVVKKLDARKGRAGEDGRHYPGQPASFHTEIG